MTAGSLSVRAVALALLVAIACLSGGCAGKKSKPAKDKFAGMGAAQVYAVAQEQIQKKKYSRARDTLQAALGRSDITPALTTQIHLALADAYFLDGGLINLAEALSRYNNFLTFYPNHERADYVQYQLGLCHLKQALSPDRDQAQTLKALNELSKVENLYPGSTFIDPATQKADEARELLAEHEFRIGYFYFRRRSFTGAVDRFKDVLEDFPRYSRRDRIYLLMGQSLLAMNRADEGRLYLEKLVSEYPDSRHAEAARQLLTARAEGEPASPLSSPQPWPAP
ncbi:MAG: outer membrane protein assembly factor BamD [Candidatus Polarisedimenticolia bacterium]